jgi:hypothetical protein
MKIMRVIDSIPPDYFDDPLLSKWRRYAMRYEKEVLRHQRWPGRGLGFLILPDQASVNQTPRDGVREPTKGDTSGNQDQRR